MKYVKIASIVLVGGIALLFGIGLLLPEWHIASRTIQLKAPPEAVWKVLTDYPSMPQWRTELERVERTEIREAGATRVIWKERLKGGNELPLEDLQSEAPRLLVRRIADPKLPFGGTWKYELRPAGEGCTVKITESGYVRIPIFRVFARFINLSATAEQFLVSLAAKFGEQPHFTAKPEVQFIDDM